MQGGRWKLPVEIFKIKPVKVGFFSQREQSNFLVNYWRKRRAAWARLVCTFETWLAGKVLRKAGFNCAPKRIRNVFMTLQLKLHNCVAGSQHFSVAVFSKQFRTRNFLLHVPRETARKYLRNYRNLVQNMHRSIYFAKIIKSADFDSCQKADVFRDKSAKFRQISPRKARFAIISISYEPADFDSSDERSKKATSLKTNRLVRACMINAVNKRISVYVLSVCEQYSNNAIQNKQNNGK